MTGVEAWRGETVLRFMDRGDGRQGEMRLEAR